MEQIQVGDILAGTWGATMVIPEFFEVVRKTAKTLYVRRMKKGMLEPNACGQQGYEVPLDPHEYRGDDEFRGRATEYGGICVTMEWHQKVYVKKWNGQPVWADYMD